MNMLSGSNLGGGVPRGRSGMALLALVLGVSPAMAGEAPAAGAPAGLGIARVMELAMDNDPGIKQAEAALEKSRARRLQYRAEYFPSVKLSMEYSHASPNDSVSVPGFGDARSSPDNSYDLHVEAKQELFSFGRTRAKVSAGDWEVRNAESSLAAARDKLALQVVRVFYRILLQQEELAADDENIKTLKEYLDMTRSRAAIGVATDFDSLTVEVKLAAAQSVRESGAGELAKSRIELARLLGNDAAARLELTGGLNPDAGVPDAAALVRFGLAHNPDLKAAYAQEKSGGENARAAALRYFPAVSAGFQYGRKNGYDPDMDRMVWNSVGFIRLEMPLFDLGVTAVRGEAVADGKAAVQARRSAMENLIADIGQALADLNASRAKMDSEKLHLALAEKAAQQARMRYEGGLITGLDLLNVQADLANARSLYSRSAYELIMAGAALKKAAGISQLDNGGYSL